MRPFLAIILLLLSILTVPAQSSHTGWETLYAQLVEEGDDTEQLDEDTYELLSELAEQPIAFNQATREDLERIPFLSDGQIEELIMYRDQSHGMRTIGELSLIESLDAVRRALLPYFITLDDDASAARFPSVGTLLKQGRHTMMGQVAVPFYERRGDRKGYLGYPYRHSLRYTFRYGSRFQAGLVAALYGGARCEPAPEDGGSGALPRADGAGSGGEQRLGVWQDDSPPRPIPHGQHHKGALEPIVMELSAGWSGRSRTLPTTCAERISLLAVHRRHPDKRR